jgi:hypothetical protein
LLSDESCPLARLPESPKSLTVSELQDEKQAARAGRLTLWPSVPIEACYRSSCRAGPGIMPVSIPRGLLKRGSRFSFSVFFN